MAKYHAVCLVPYSCEQMFDLVADVESYPRFVPWWIDAEITGKSAGVYTTVQTMGLGPVRLHFNSQTVMDRPKRIRVTARGGGLRTLELTWHFEHREHGCLTSLEMDMEMATRALGIVVSRLSRDAASTLMDAFRKRARVLYGKDMRFPERYEHRA